ncbi:hypothetical protein SAMN05216339_102253 [Nitrosomonas eutropha]|uniref:Uncharacterized protein n=1 Tax=Nitrosomonas eutropha TaxID=916 RepID=A0A1I7G6S6_9PROT|nr:hypothetical protein SAMN05216339_102253 [Nitrosomonas eutropha]
MYGVVMKIEKNSILLWNRISAILTAFLTYSAFPLLLANRIVGVIFWIVAAVCGQIFRDISQREQP